MLVRKDVFVYICIVEKHSCETFTARPTCSFCLLKVVVISALTSSPPLYCGPNPTRLLPPNTESAREGLALGGVVSEARHSADALQVSLERVGG